MSAERPSFNPENPDLPGYNPEKSVEAPPIQEASKEKEINPEAAESHKKLEVAIDQFRSGTSFEVVREEGKEVLVSPEGERFYVSELKDPSDKSVGAAHALLMKEFGKDMVEPISWWKHAIQEGLYKYNVVKNEGGEVVSVSVLQQLDLKQREGSTPGQPQEAMFAEWFVHTNPKQAKSDELSRHVLASACESGLGDLKASGVKFKGFVGESVTDLETKENEGMHKKRMFIETAQGDVREVPYFYPPSEFDDNTGKPDSETGPARLMARMLDSSKGMSVSDLLGMVGSMYQEYLATPDDYKNRPAYETAKAFIDNMLAKLESALAESKDGVVTFMSQGEIRAKESEIRDQGHNLIEVIPD